MKRHLIALVALIAVIGVATSAAYAMPDLSEDEVQAATAVEATSYVPYEQQAESPYQYAL